LSEYKTFKIQLNEPFLNLSLMLIKSGIKLDNLLLEEICIKFFIEDNFELN
jgi:hypothetical protein